MKIAKLFSNPRNSCKRVTSWERYDGRFANRLWQKHDFYRVRARKTRIVNYVYENLHHCYFAFEKHHRRPDNFQKCCRWTWQQWNCRLTKSIWCEIIYPSQLFFCSARSDICKRHMNVSRQTYSFLKLRLLLFSEEKRTRTNKISVIRIYILYLHAVLIKRPGPASQSVYDVSKQHVHGKFHILFLWKQILGDISCIRNTPKQCITWQITEVSNSAKRHADNSGNYAD